MTHMRINSIGFYSLNGCNVIENPQNTRSLYFCTFLHKIRATNPYGLICIILDNYTVHKSKIVLHTARSLGILLVYLPPYSPDLNPIEYIWKSVKAIISESKFENTFELKNCVEKNFMEFSHSTSYASSWLEKIDLSNWLI
jgi:putative transposase